MAPPFADAALRICQKATSGLSKCDQRPVRAIKLLTFPSNRTILNSRVGSQRLAADIAQVGKKPRSNSRRGFCLSRHPWPQQAVRDLARVARDIPGNLPPLPGISPDMPAPVVINQPGGREMVMMRWGFRHTAPGSGEKIRRGYVTNVRHTDSVFWRPYLMRPELRCLVPATSFCEPDNRSGKTVWTRFALDESRPLFFFAGVWRTWMGTRGTKSKPEEGEHLLFSFLTTNPNSEVAPIHPKAMPVLLLDETACDTWLSAPVEEALKLQRSPLEGTLKIVRTGDKEDIPVMA